MAKIATGERVNTLSLSGEAKVRATNDRVSLTVTVLTQKKTMELALQEHTEKVDAIVAVVDTNNVTRDYLQTNGPQLTNWTENVQRGKGKYRKWVVLEKGWQAFTTIDITIKDLANFMPIYTSIAKLEPTGIGEPSYGINDPAKYMDDARREAAKALLNKAILYSEAFNVSLVAPSAISERFETVGDTESVSNSRMAYPASASLESFAPAAAMPASSGGSQLLKVVLNCTFIISDFNGDITQMAAKSAKKAK